MKKSNHKVTLEVRKQIKELALNLPSVPYLNKGKLQYVASSKVIKGDDLIKQGTKEVNNHSVNPDKNYISKGTTIRSLNHSVELTTAFQRKGQLGIDEYVDYVNRLNTAIIEAQKPVEKTKVINDEPRKEDFGYVASTSAEDGGTSGWTVEGGEDAYNKALFTWEQQFNKPEVETTEQDQANA